VVEDGQKLEEYLQYTRQHNRTGKHYIDVTSKMEWDSIVEKSMKPVIVDFYKLDSEDCKRLLPRLMDKYMSSPEEWLLVGADIDKMKDIAQDFNVVQVPSVFLIHNGKVIDRFSGTDDHLDLMVTTVEQLSSGNE